MSKKIDDNLVVKSNELIQASYAMTLNEQRLLLACISQIDSRKAIEADCEFVLTVEKARDLFYSKGDQRNAYRDLQDASERLFERKVKIALGDNKELLTRFIQSVEFDQNNGQIMLVFANKIKPYLSQLERNFTQYRLQNVVQLTSTYAVRIYELIVSWTGQNQSFKEMEIKEFRELLALEYKYKQFGQLRDKVISPAVEQINESTDFELDISFKKSKRTFKWIQMRFNRKPAAQSAEITRKAARIAKHERNKQAQAKREREEAIRARQESAKNVEFPPDYTIIRLRGVLAQIEDKNARVIEGEDAGAYIPHSAIVKAIASGKLDIVEPDDEALEPFLDDNGNLDLFGF